MSVSTKFGPVAVEPGVSTGNMWALMFAAFVSIGMVTGMAAMTPYILTANLGIRRRRIRAGRSACSRCGRKSR